MPHHARLWPASQLHLVTIAGNGGSTIFLDNTDRELFLDLLDDVVGRFEWELYAWCQLGTHAHLVASADPAQLAAGMQRLKGIYAVQFHRRHHTSGHLFKRPYDSRPIVTSEHLHRACSYTLRNAPRHGFTQRAEDWEWSSFRTSAGLDAPPRPHLACEPFDRLLDLAGADRLSIMRVYAHDSPPRTVVTPVAMSN